MASLLDPPISEKDRRAEQMVDAVKLAWMAPFLRAKAKLCTPDELARWFRCNRQHIYTTIKTTECLETVGVGRHIRIAVRSALVWGFNQWSGRHTASPEQLFVFILALLKHLPTVMLRAIRDVCDEAIDRQKESERNLCLEVTASSSADVRSAFINGKQLIVAATKSGLAKPPPRPKANEPTLFDA